MILYGERGVGKTSIANILSELMVKSEDEVREYAVRVNCGTDDTFGSIWSRAFSELGLDADSQWTYHPPSPDELRLLLSRLSGAMAIVFDEYDRLQDDSALSAMADTLKALSDRQVASKIVLVGVSDSVDDLVGEHESVRRAIEEVQVPRMEEAECAQVVDRGMGAAGMDISDDAKRRIVRLSEGLPSYVHLLALRSGERAVYDDRTIVEVADIMGCTEEIVKRHSSKRDYQNAVQSSRPEALYAQVLAACALAEKDDLGYFTAKAVTAPLSKIMEKEYKIPAFSNHLAQFQTMDRGEVLTRKGSQKNYRYRFRDPLMQPLAIIAAISHNLIPTSYMDEFFEAPIG